MEMVAPGPDLVLGPCFDCFIKSRLFEFMPGHWICLSCYRDLVDAALETAYEEDADAAP